MNAACERRRESTRATGRPSTSLVLAKDYEASLRRVAQEAAAANCESNRWRLGWVRYKAAAEENAHFC